MKLRLFLVTVLVFLSFSAVVFAQSFPDVAEDHPNYLAVEYLDENGIINGYDDGTFGPNDLVTRAQALKIILNSTAVQISENYDEEFSDVAESAWFFGYVMTAEDEEIVKGFPDGTFRPDQTVNLAETLKILTLAAELSDTDSIKLPGQISDDVFGDVPADSWYAPYMLYARNKNVIEPDDFGNVQPDQAMTRAAFAEVVYRMAKVQESHGDPYPLHENWGTHHSGELPFQMSYDNENWDLIENPEETVFFKSDKEFLQFSPARLYPNSAVIRITVDPNALEMSQNQYFSNLRNAFPDAEDKQFELSGFAALEIYYPSDRIRDWYIYLDDGRVLVVYSQYGSGGLGYRLSQFIDAMLSTFEYRDVPVTPAADFSDLLSDILEKVLIEGEGMAMLEQLPEKIIIETDTIGVGTGAVDYYYSESLDYTFKYERASDVILAAREGETTKF
jgi:hypothetical protein